MAPAFVQPLPLTSSVILSSSASVHSPQSHANLTRLPHLAVARRAVSISNPRMALESKSKSPSPSSHAPQLSPIIPILMGSDSDRRYCEEIAAALIELGLHSELRIASAHKIPTRLMQLVQQYEDNPRPKVYIAVAGRSNALSGMLDCAVSAPVVSCPPPSDAFAGADIFSSIRMPSGVAPAFVLEPGTAALLAAKILGVYDDEIRARVEALQKANRVRLYLDDAHTVAQTYRGAIADVREADSTMVATDGAMVFGSGLTAQAIKGMVRDRYEFTAVGDDGKPQDLVALVTTDRLSAFDRVFASIPFKGAALNLTSAWWFEQTKHIIPNHVVAVPHPYVTLAKKCTPFPVEFAVCAYLTESTSTSLWKKYKSGVRNYCGVEFPDGLKKNQKLERNVLTPTTKAEEGDEPIAPPDVVKRGLMTQADWDVCAKAAMDLFAFGQSVVSDRGLILVETKYQFGRADDGTICLIDEVHTPDSSTFWFSTEYLASMERYVVTEYLRFRFRDNFDMSNSSKAAQAPPAYEVDELSSRYVMLYELITGEPFNLDAASAGAESITSAMAPYVANMTAPASR